MINRRTFIGCATLAAFAPMPDSRTRPLPVSDAKISRMVLVIDGWAILTDDDDVTGKLSIRISPGWRASWR